MKLYCLIIPRRESWAELDFHKSGLGADCNLERYVHSVHDLYRDHFRGNLIQPRIPKFAPRCNLAVAFRMRVFKQY